MADQGQDAIPQKPATNIIMVIPRGTTAIAARHFCDSFEQNAV